MWLQVYNVRKIGLAIILIQLASKFWFLSQNKVKINPQKRLILVLLVIWVNFS